MEKSIESPILNQGEQKEQIEGYEEVEQRKKQLYDNLINESSEDLKTAKENTRDLLYVHEDIVLQYGDELIEKYPNLSKEEKIATRLALMLHDSGKIEAGLLEHHQQGSVNAEKILLELQQERHKIEGIEITDEIIKKVKQAIDRHMNHPFLVDLKKGERFPEPEDDVDKIVFDADMMANVGAKNVGNRLNNEGMISEDHDAALETGTSHIEAAFNNVIDGAKSLDKVVLSEPGKERIKELIKDLEVVMEKLREKGEDDKNILERVQDEFSDELGRFNAETIKEKGGVPLIIERLNEEIAKAGQGLVDEKILNNFRI
jgi:hypothetical protein